MPDDSKNVNGDRTRCGRLPLSIATRAMEMEATNPSRIREVGTRKRTPAIAIVGEKRTREEATAIAKVGEKRTREEAPAETGKITETNGEKKREIRGERRTLTVGKRGRNAEIGKMEETVIETEIKIKINIEVMAATGAEIATEIEGEVQMNTEKVIRTETEIKREYLEVMERGIGKGIH